MILDVERYAYRDGKILEDPEGKLVKYEDWLKLYSWVMLTQQDINAIKSTIARIELRTKEDFSEGAFTV